MRLTILDTHLLDNEILKVPIKIKSRAQSTRASYKSPNLHHFNVENCNDYLVQLEREEMEDNIGGSFLCKTD